MKLFIITRSLLLALALGLQVFLIARIKENVDRNTALKVTSKQSATQPAGAVKELAKSQQTGIAANF